jgi:hypothetical protein
MQSRRGHGLEEQPKLSSGPVEDPEHMANGGINVRFVLI